MILPCNLSLDLSKDRFLRGRPWWWCCNCCCCWWWCCCCCSCWSCWSCWSPMNPQSLLRLILCLSPPEGRVSRKFPRFCSAKSNEKVFSNGYYEINYKLARFESNDVEHSINKVVFIHSSLQYAITFIS